MSSAQFKACICTGCQGKMWYNEIEDFNPGSDPEWSIHPSWCCDTCAEYISSCDDRFEYPE